MPKLPYRLVQTEAALQAAVLEIQSAPSLAFDLEFDSHRNAYGTTLCLIQIATPDACFIVDPLAEIALAPLFQVFSDPAVLKIVHSPGEDLRVLHGLGCIPQHLFDTEIAAKLLDYEYTSLAALLDQKLSVILNKGQQRSNWIRRPLSADQLLYAADDVLHLHALKAALEAEAASAGLLPLVLDEQAVWSTGSYAQDEQKTNFLKGADLQLLSTYDQHVLNGLFRYRDDLARGLNKPAFQVLDEPLLRGLMDGSLLPDDLPYSKGIYGSYKTERFADQTERRLQALRDEAAALQLSREREPRKHFSPEERAARARADRDRTAVFEPLQAALVERYGTFAGRFLLSKTKVEEVLRGNILIGTMRPLSRGGLLSAMAAETGVDISRYY